MKKMIATDAAPKAVGPYSQAVLTDGFMFVSGQLPLDAAGNLVEGLENQVKQCMANIEAILAEGGLVLEDIVRATIYITDFANFETVNNIYQSYFTTGYYPARATIGINSLAKSALVEIDAMALKR